MLMMKLKRQGLPLFQIKIHDDKLNLIYNFNKRRKKILEIVLELKKKKRKIKNEGDPNMVVKKKMQYNNNNKKEICNIMNVVFISQKLKI